MQRTQSAKNDRARDHFLRADPGICEFTMYFYDQIVMIKLRHVLEMNWAQNLKILIFLYNFCFGFQAKFWSKSCNYTITVKNSSKNKQKSQYFVQSACKTWRTCLNCITFIFQMFLENFFDEKSTIRKIKGCYYAYEASTWVSVWEKISASNRIYATGG